MKRIFKWIFLLVPILAWLSLVGSCLYKNIRVDREIQEADGLVWENNGKPLTVRVKKEDRGEISDYTILVLDAGERTVHESKIAFKRDMFGGGFVKAMNADEDPVPEVLAWGFHEGKISFILDPSGDTVRKIPYPSAPAKVKSLTRRWYEANVSDLAGGFLLFLPLAAYYVIIGLVFLFIRLSRNRERGKETKRT